MNGTLKWAAAVGIAAATWMAPAALAADENVIHGAEFEDGRIIMATQAPLPREAFGRAEIEKKSVRETTLPAAGKIQPALLDLIAGGGDPGKPVEIVVTYQDNLPLPTFPEPAFHEERESAYNQTQLREANRLVAELRAQRAERYKAQSAELERAGGKVLDTYWLIQGAHVSLPLDAVKRVAAADDVAYVELADDGARPPADANPDNDAIDARAQIRSDPYFNLGQTAGWIGLLDTGVRTTHVVFNGPNHVGLRMDVTGDDDPTDQCDHGTASAALISGNSALGGNWRGVTESRVDSYDVYGDNCGYSSAHAVIGFQYAVMFLDKVIVAELQANSSSSSAISTAADNAFNAGAVVIAANGNFGPGVGTVRAPGNAHRALGIGAANLESDQLRNYSGRGPTSDGRYKPDLVFPTDVETARGASNTARDSFGGTSAATPIAGGAAALLRNWMRGGTGAIDPGHVYSHMILGGQTTWPFNNDTGAGPFKLGVNGFAWHGKSVATHGNKVDIPLEIKAGRTVVEAALWWPENHFNHNDVDLEIVSPAGIVREHSVSVLGVFERASVKTNVYPGTWKLRIKGYSVPLPQLTYWSAQTY